MNRLKSSIIASASLSALFFASVSTAHAVPRSVPESSSTLLLLGAAVAGLLMFRRKLAK